MPRILCSQSGFSHCGTGWQGEKEILQRRINWICGSHVTSLQACRCTTTKDVSILSFFCSSTGDCKTRFILFYSPRMSINLDGLSISIDNNRLNRVENTRFLGVIIHHNLSWQPHIKAISSRVAKSIGIITKSRQSFLTNTLCALYYSLNTLLPTVLLYRWSLYLFLSSTTNLWSPKESRKNHDSLSPTCTYLPSF